MNDSFGRTINYLRISITDRCNLRCQYCMPHGIETVPMKDILSYEELAQVARTATDLGITRFKVTGGEPLARKGCPDFVRMLKELPGTEQVTLTTNGVLLEEALPALLGAGLDAVNISLDTLDRDAYRDLTGTDALPAVLDSIQACLSAKLPTKINAVLLKDVNDTAWESLAELAKEQPLDVRFIERMPIGFGREFPSVSGEDLRKTIQERYPDLQTDPAPHGNGPAVYYRIPGWQGSIGLINALHGPFCGSCNRIRLTAQGKLKPCLCYGDTVELRAVLRETELEHRDAALRQALKTAIQNKPARHCFSEQSAVTEQHPMVEIGG